MVIFMIVVAVLIADGADRKKLVGRKIAVFGSIMSVLLI